MSLRIQINLRESVRDASSFLAVVLIALSAPAQTLPLPSRSPNAPTGTAFTNIIAGLGVTERERWIFSQVMDGNVPEWFRALTPVAVAATGHTGTFYAAPDYLAIGSDDDYFLIPCTPIVAQRLATRFGLSLPTRRMVNQIWTNAAVKLTPVPFSPATYDILSLGTFGLENAAVRAQRDTFTNAHPLGALVSGDKKDVVISNEITNRPPPPRVVIYGWHYPNGAFIQPLSAVHEETYADYSHGIRFVQQSMTVDGAGNTVSNVLKSASLHPLLSDEGVIPLPHYTVAAQPPIVMIHPRSRTVYAGQEMTLACEVIGDGPLLYQWFHNNNPVTSETNMTLHLEDLSSLDAGSYWLATTNTSGNAVSRTAVVSVLTNSYPLLYSNGFDSETGVEWEVFWGAANGIPDYTVDWSFDHSATPYKFNGVTTLIPPAPNSLDGDTRALKLTVNNNDLAGSIAAVNLYPKNLTLSGDFAFKFDLWINYPGNMGGINSTGSTQHASFGINHLGTNVNWAAPSASASDGLWFAVDGEGGTTTDYRAYQGNPAGTQIDLTATLNASNNSDPLYQSLFPATRFETAGSPGKNWVEVEVQQVGNVVSWLINGTTISQRLNSSEFTNGEFMLGFMDTFNSIANPARDAFVLFDNVRVESLAPPPIRFESIIRLSNSMISLVLTSAPLDVLWLEQSTNLATWTPLATLHTTTNGLATFLDSAVGDRYYRARR